MATHTNQMEDYLDHERTVADRYRWWGVYLVREKRRLQAIADAVQAGEAAAAMQEMRVPGAITIDDKPDTETDEKLTKKLSGRAALLGGTREENGEDD